MLIVVRMNRTSSPSVSDPCSVNWIVFDGDVDPDWVENLNALLDDNRLLTLPNGERIPLKDNTRILFEIDSLNHATPATVSRCGSFNEPFLLMIAGMVYFTAEVVTPQMVLQSFLATLTSQSLRGLPVSKELLSTQLRIVEVLRPLCESDGLVENALALACKEKHTMQFSPLGSLEAALDLFHQGCCC